jgi:hypothetical protein
VFYSSRRSIPLTISRDPAKLEIIQGQVTDADSIQWAKQSTKATADA